jgi:outer membrane receptor protein involved in Fe transport
MRSIKVLTSPVLALTLFIMMTAVVYAAPGATDEIQGTIKDALGRPLPGASLVLKSSDETVMGKTQSDADGHFVFSNVTPGVYAILAEKTGFQASTAIATVEAGTIATTTLTMTAEEALEVSVIAERLNQARSSLSPKTGGSEYHFDQDDVTALPQGENTSFNQVLLQAPGVANDSFGQLHVRGDHANIQYRINGVILPEGISGFGQAFDTRFVNRVDLLTGALPAQYGDREAGVIEIETKANPETGGRIDLYGGSRNTVQPSFEYGGSTGKLTYYTTGSYLGNDLGIENPTRGSNAIHDHTDQVKGFGFMSYLINSTTKISLMFGSYDGWFRIPNNPGQSPYVGWPAPPANPANVAALAAAGFGTFNSSSLNERQYENNRYGVIALQSSIGANFDYQLSFVTRYSSLNFTPDPVGDLVFDGASATLSKSSFVNGLQGDGSYHLNNAHTIRLGFFASYEDITSNSSSTVLPVTGTDNNGNPIYGTTTTTVTDNNPKNGNVLTALYLQDEWKPINKLTVNYGLRFDYVDAFVSANQVSPRLGLVYKATPNTTLHAAYARYFTPPPSELVASKTLNLFANTSNAAPSTLNSPVLPERSHYFDAGVNQKITSELTVGVDGYYKIIHDLIDEGQFGPAPILSPFNYQEGKIYGVEVTGNYHSGNFSAYGNFAYAVSMAKNVVSAQWNFGQDELNYIANNWVHTDHDQTFTASAGLSYNWLGTLLSTDATYGSGLRSGFANTDHVPDNIQVNLGAKRKFELESFGPVEARMSIINVTDRVNPIREGGGIGVFAPQYGPRIGFFGGISKLF